MSDARGKPEATQTDLATFLREAQDTIIHEWEEAAVALPRAREIDRPTLIEFIPPLLDSVADMLDDLTAHPPPPPDEPAAAHALNRLEEGWDLEDVIIELSLLRDTILRIRHDVLGDTVEQSQTRLLNHALDRVMITSAMHFTRMRDNLLASLDRVSQAALFTGNFQELLDQLIQIFRDETASVDAGVILIREGNVLRVRASAGSVAPPIGTEVPMGRDFAGTIAATGRPLSLNCDDGDPLTANDPTCRGGIKAIHGIPLLESGQIVGVAQMASMNAPSFSEQDRALFASMATRAAAAINQQILREDAERRARELQISEIKFRSTFEAAALGIAHLAPDGRWLRLNRRYCEILGRSHEELLSASFREVTHPADLPHDLQLMSRFQRGELQEASYEKRYLRKDGAVVWVQLMISAVRDADGELLYFIAAANDISEQKRLRDRLSFLAEASAVLAADLEYHATLQRVAELAAQSLADWCIVDILEPNGEIDDFVAIAHRDPARIPLMREMRRLYPPSPDDPMGAPKVMRTGEADFLAEIDPVRVAAYARDEHHRNILAQLQLQSLLVLPLEINGRILGALTLLTDRFRAPLDEIDVATARELATRAAMAIENSRLHEETKRAVQLRDRVLAIVAHDLRSPLTTINLSSSVVRKCAAVTKDPQTLRAVEAIERNVARSKRLIDDLLDMSSIQSGHLALHLGTCEVASILTEIVDQFIPVAQAAGVELVYRFSFDRVTIHCDRDRLLQVLSNLLGNAVKFCSTGDRVELRADANDGQVIIEVADTGSGINPDDLPHVFDLYWRSEKREGTGLGLFISRGIVHAHGGKIEATSPPQGGTTFRITLPAAR